MRKETQKDLEEQDREEAEEPAGLHVPGGVPSGASGGTAGTGGTDVKWKIKDPSVTGAPSEQEQIPHYMKQKATVDSLYEISREESWSDSLDVQLETATNDDETVREYIMAEAEERAKNANKKSK